MTLKGNTINKKLSCSKVNLIPCRSSFESPHSANFIIISNDINQINLFSLEQGRARNTYFNGLCT